MKNDNLFNKDVIKIALTVNNVNTGNLLSAKDINGITLCNEIQLL